MKERGIMGSLMSSVAVRFCITIIVLAIVLFVFEDALLELVLGAGAEQGTLIRFLEVLIAFVVSFLAVNRAFQIGQHRV